jgi:hypothetical protein
MVSSENDPSPQTIATGGPARPPTHPPALGPPYQRETGMSGESLVLILLLGAGTLWLLSVLYEANRLKLDNLSRNYDYCIEEVAAGQKDLPRTETRALLDIIHKCVDGRLQVEDALETNGMRD